METVISGDGTAIAYDRLGEGPAVVVLGGASCDRAMTRPTAEGLAEHFTVFNFDRRGRGDSGDAATYAVEREIEDLAAVVDEAGVTACVYGHSSGAGLVLRAAAFGLPVRKVVLHDPPYSPDDEEMRRTAREYGEKLAAVLSKGRRGDALELFFSTVGMPPEMIGGMRGTPRWAELEAMAHTLAYDSAVMGDVSRDGTIPVELVGGVTVPALVLTGGEDFPWMTEVGRRLAEAMPEGRHQALRGQEHVVPPGVLVPVLAAFFGPQGPRPARGGA